MIGRNNSGKSSLLDVIEYATSPKNKNLSASGHKGKKAAVIITKPLEESELKMVFKEDTSGGPINGNHWEFGKRFIGKWCCVG